MPLTPAQIKDKLTNALDDDKNVIDEKAVEEVIALLETSTITKEILEQTRLGRDINLVRKTSKNPAIAKRAKNLVKAWKKLIVVPGSPQVANGQHPVQRISPGLSPASSRCSTPVKCLPSPALINARQQVTKSLGSRSPGVQLVSRVGQQPLPPSKLAQQDITTRYITGSKSPKSVGVGQVLRHASITINEESNLSWPRTPPSNLSESSQDRLIGDRENQESSSAGGKAGSEKRNFNFDSQSVHSTETTSKSANRAPDQRDVSKANVANRKRTRSSHIDDSNDSFPDPPLSKQPRLVSSSPSLSTLNRSDVINGAVVKRSNVKSPGLHARDGLIIDSKATVSSSRFNHQDVVDVSVLPNRIHQNLAYSRQDSVDSRLSVHSSDSRSFREKLGKVKTTEQIIEDMQRKSATTVGTSVIAQIRTNQIRKESDSQKNVLPPGKKRRGRKKKQERELPDTESVSDGRRLAQAKMENIERFLRTSVLTPEDVYEHSLHNLRQESLDEQPLPLGGCSSAFSQPAYDSGFHTYSSRQDKPDSGPSASPPETRDLLEGLCNMPSTAAVLGDTSSERLSEEQILARLPHIDYDSVDWSLHDYQAPQVVSVTDDLVYRLHKENMDGINGTIDRDGQFKKWQEMLTVDSSYDEPLFILPYVIPND
ncbi:unnamed protein product [Lymnaea stagnalis]|uniref:Mediator of RNA polymerase II transcription subunit 26 n=1 Tax=Lymnaea stagnalis TaxID=6523 RepID=A0AAV2HLY2_LYMST